MNPPDGYEPHDAEQAARDEAATILNPFWFRDKARRRAFLKLRSAIPIIAKNFEKEMDYVDSLHPDDKHLERLVYLLGHLIFGVSFAGKVEVEWACGQEFEDMYSDATLLPDGRVKIRLSLARNDTWRLIVMTLLHEMCHAYFWLFICKENPRTPERCGYTSHAGMTGHGWVWKKLALAVKRFAANLFEKEDLDIWRPHGLMFEAIQRGGMLPALWLAQFFNEAKRRALEMWVRGPPDHVDK